MTATRIAEKDMTPADVVAAWDRGDSLWSVEMGGLGPGYEQVIHTAMIELLRDNIDVPLPEPKDAHDWGDATLHKHDESLGGMSGAQAGAAKGLAYRILCKGYAATLDSMREHDKERLIQVSKAWPRAAAHV